MAIKVWSLFEKFKLSELNANFQEVGGYSSYTPIASNLGTITTHLAMKKGGIARYKLYAQSGTWVGGTPYVLTTLNNIYRPVVKIEKNIMLRNGIQAYLYISVDGLVQIIPWASFANSAISIDETYIL